jgi:hypothetical protein
MHARVTLSLSLTTTRNRITVPASNIRHVANYDTVSFARIFQYRPKTEAEGTL